MNFPNNRLDWFVLIELKNEIFKVRIHPLFRTPKAAIKNSRIIAALTGTVGRASKRSLIVRPMVSGPVPCSGARSATEQGAGRSQRRDSRRRSRRERFELTCRPPDFRGSSDFYVKPHKFSGQAQRLVKR